MDELTSSIKMLNLAFTNTFYNNGINMKSFKLDEVKINFENSISLYDILDKFNKLYISFKKEYRSLDKLYLFEKYSILLYLYYHFKNAMIFSDGANALSTEICGEYRDFLDNLDKFKISILMNPNDKIKIVINLGSKFGINVDESELKIEDQLINANEDGFLYILKNIYINEKYLNTYWDRVDHKKKVSAKSLIKKADNV